MTTQTKVIIGAIALGGLYLLLIKKNEPKKVIL